VLVAGTISLLSALVPSVLSSAAPHPVEARSRVQVRPNIVMIMVDDMRDDDLRFMPYTRQYIRDRGVRFLNSFSPDPLCCPARASVLTGLYTHNHGVYDVVPPYGFSSFHDRSTIATWLRSAGYETIYLGKYLNGYGQQPRPGASSGKSLFYVPPGWSDWRASIDGGLPQSDPRAGGTYLYYDTTISQNGAGLRNFAGRYQTRVYGDISAQVVATRTASPKPFFFYISFVAPHNGGPIEPDDPGTVLDPRGQPHTFGTPARPDSVKGMFDAVVKAAPGASWNDPDFSDKPSYLQRPPFNGAELNAMLEVTRQRAEALSVVDQQVKRIVDALRASGELGRTLVMFTSDNGYYLGEQRRGDGKVYPHEPSLRVPMLVRGPGIPAGAVRRDPITSIDVAPTLAAFAGVTPATPVDGASLLGVARHGDVGWRRPILTESRPTPGIVRETDIAGGPLQAGEAPDVRYAIGVRTPRYLYVNLATGEEELYDLSTDPRQYVNLVHDAASAAVLEQLRATLARLRACRGATCRSGG
jgi:arylsulfatase A-like enzyme